MKKPVLLFAWILAALVLALTLNFLVLQSQYQVNCTNKKQIVHHFEVRRRLFSWQGECLGSGVEPEATEIRVLTGADCWDTLQKIGAEGGFCEAKQPLAN